MNCQLAFGGFTVDPRTRTLIHDGRRVPLQQQPLELLLLLIENPDGLVTRDAIRERIWPDAAVEFDLSINYAIRQIRIALGEESGRLQTVPRRGYRFVGPVIRTGDRGGMARQTRPLMRRRAVPVAVLAVVLASAFGAGIVAAHTESGTFIYEHIVHPDHCPYIRMLIPALRRS